MSFDQGAVKTLFDQVLSHTLTLGIFERVNQHEPKVAPGNGLSAAIWVQDIRPAGNASGLAATSGLVTLNIRIYTNFLSHPLDDIDPNLLTATTTLLNAYTGDFNLGGNVRNIDLLGQFGNPMAATAGYLNQDNRIFRIVTINLPVVINDLWTQTP